MAESSMFCVWHDLENDQPISDIWFWAVAHSLFPVLANPAEDYTKEYNNSNSMELDHFDFQGHIYDFIDSAIVENLVMSWEWDTIQLFCVAHLSEVNEELMCVNLELARLFVHLL